MIGTVLSYIAIGATIAALTVFVLLNLILGCGETIYTAAGPVPGECFIINQ